MSKWKRRPDGKTVKRNSHRIEGQFAPRLIDMLGSPPYRVLNLAEHRVLARLEIELASHGGLENGNLIVTYEQFADYGVRDQSVASAIRATAALGFITVKPGRGGNSEFYNPSKYELTYRHIQYHRYGDIIEPTNDWKRIKTVEEAQQIAKTARQEKSETRLRRRRQKNRNPPSATAVDSTAETGVGKGGSAPPNRRVRLHRRNGGSFLDSRGGGGDDGGEVLNPLPASAVLPSDEGRRDGPAPLEAQGQHRAAAPSDLQPISALGTRETILTAGSSTVLPFPNRRAAP